MSNPLFTPYQLGRARLKNRLVMAPLTRSRAIGNMPNGLMARYYEQRNGAGLIITEGTSPSPNGLGYPRIPGLFNAEQAEAWKNITARVHKGGSHIFVQLMHTGRIGHALNLPEGAKILAPSAVKPDGQQMYTDQEGMKEIGTPQAMTAAEVEAAIGEHVQAARYAIAAGFDGVELHGANGYLIEQFLNPKSNVRADEYGGSVENRARFLLDMADRVGEAIGADKVGVRLSPFGVNAGMPVYDEAETIEMYQYLAEALNGRAVYLHIADHSSMGAPEVPQSLKESMRNAFSGTFLLSGGYDQERAVSDLEAGRGDLVAFGRMWLANPDLDERFRAEAELNTPDFDTFYTPGEKGYTDYPALAEASQG
ncbi:alkene reductase [Phaeodactylibacter luteus]|uniref:Alkene reductase n=1 Tax=Phaeodactylibacter luteus TaxID=1564516 RepID=A0A5C6RQB6_9BACT|nr:alkene reductase [Phaeodactylibacter luteus]TXB64105.1 alkene reductase [Phaeodactylibacter luteus]